MKHTITKPKTMGFCELTKDEVLMWEDHIYCVLDECNWQQIKDCCDYAEALDYDISGDDDKFYDELYPSVALIAEPEYPTQEIEDKLLPVLEDGEEEEVMQMFSVLRDHSQWELIARALKLVLKIGW